MNARTKCGHKLNAKVPFKGHPSARPFLYALGEETTQPVHPIMDLRKYDNVILDQGQEGDCTAAASGGVWLYLQILKWRVANRATYTPEELQAFIRALLPCSMDFIYALELVHDGDFGQDNGSYGLSAAYVLENFGACFADIWPNTHQGFHVYPTAEALAEAAKHKVSTHQLRDLFEIRRCHSEGYPTFFGVPVFSSWANTVTTDIPMPTGFDQVVGGHEMKTIGHDDSKGVLIMANSWGSDVGDGGYFHMPYEYFQKYASDVHTARVIK